MADRSEVTDRMLPRHRRHRERLIERLGEDEDGPDDPDPVVEPVPKPAAVEEPETTVESEDAPSVDPPVEVAATVVEVDDEAAEQDDDARVAPSVDPTDKRSAICVRCGAVHERRGRQPLWDDDNTVWYACRNGCEVPEAADWPATTVGMSDIASSRFDPSALDPDDHLAPSDPEPEAADGPDAGDDTPDDPPTDDPRDEPAADDPPEPRSRRRRAPPRRGVPALRTRRGRPGTTDRVTGWPVPPLARTRTHRRLPPF